MLENVPGARFPADLARPQTGESTFPHMINARFVYKANPTFIAFFESIILVFSVIFASVAFMVYNT